MMRGMFAAISGLQVHQTMLDVAANDIANVNTVGYKGEATSFKDALSQLQKGASTPGTSATARIVSSMADNIDVDVSGVLADAESLAAAGDRLFEELLAT